MEYQIIALQGAISSKYVDKLTELEENVSSAIARGWVPLGPVAIAVFPAGFMFAQTMICNKIVAD
jgi:hypothetical protein